MYDLQEALTLDESGFLPNSTDKSIEDYISRARRMQTTLQSIPGVVTEIFMGTNPLPGLTFKVVLPSQELKNEFHEKFETYPLPGLIIASSEYNQPGIEGTILRVNHYSDLFLPIIGYNVGKNDINHNLKSLIAHESIHALRAQWKPGRELRDEMIEEAFAYLDLLPNEDVSRQFLKSFQVYCSMYPRVGHPIIVTILTICGGILGLIKSNIAGMVVGGALGFYFPTMLIAGWSLPRALATNTIFNKAIEEGFNPSYLYARMDLHSFKSHLSLEGQIASLNGTVGDIVRAKYNIAKS